MQRHPGSAHTRPKLRIPFVDPIAELGPKPWVGGVEEHLLAGLGVFDHDHAESVERVHDYLAEIGIAWCGRYGDWGYLWTDDAFLSGERAAETVLSGIVKQPTPVSG